MRSKTRFVVLFVVLVAAFEAFYTFALPGIAAYEAYLASMARWGTRLLQLLGMDASCVGRTVRCGRDQIRLSHGCDPIEATAMLFIAVFLYPAPWRSKLLVCVISAAALYILNLMRVAALACLAGTTWAFNALHLSVGPLVLILAAMAIWAYWTKRWAPPTT